MIVTKGDGLLLHHDGSGGLEQAGIWTGLMFWTLLDTIRTGMRFWTLLDTIRTGMMFWTLLLSYTNEYQITTWEGMAI